MPEDSEPPIARRGVVESTDRSVDPEHLVILSEDLDETPGAFYVGHEVLNHVEESTGVAERVDRSLQRDNSRLGLVVNPLPFAEPLPRRESRTHLRLGASR